MRWAVYTLYNASAAGINGAWPCRMRPTLVSSHKQRDTGEMRRAVGTILALVCLGVGLARCESSGEPSGDRLVREYAECMADNVKGVDNTYHCGGGMLYHLGDA